MHIQQFKSLDSTNNEAKRQLKIIKNNPHFETVIVADTQTGGRGRASKIWESNPGGLYYTFVKKPTVLDQFKDVFEVSQKVGKSVQVAIQTLTGVQTQLEWPNDILLDHKKCGGILIETISGQTANQPKWVIVGVGLNINQETFSQPLKHVAISLRQSTGNQYNKHDFINALTKELSSWL